MRSSPSAVRRAGGRRRWRVHVDVVGDALAGDVEGGAVIDRGAVDRQAERDVHRGVEGDELDRDVALVVVLGDDQVEGAVVGAVEDGVGGDRALHVDAFGAGALATAGAICSSSSVPKRPFSPQCGLMPATAMRGLAYADAARGARCRRGWWRARARAWRGRWRSRSETWVETWMTLSRSEASSMKARLLRRSARASMPVWPS